MSERSYSSAAIDAVTERALADRSDATQRWLAAMPADAPPLDHVAAEFARTVRVTLSFHPDRFDRSGRSVAEGLLEDGVYRSQWSTGLSSGSRSALRGGDRDRFERTMFAGAYDTADPDAEPFPVYGSIDLLRDPHGGSPRFGSCFVVLSGAVVARTTMCVGDSHVGPTDVGTFTAAWSVLAGLAEQAAGIHLLDRDLGTDALLAALRGRFRSPLPARCLDGYVEAQVHGGVDLATDVPLIVLDPSFRGTEVEAHMVAAANQFGFDVAWHGGSELHVDDVPSDFRGPTMPALAGRVARSDGIIDAAGLGRLAARPGLLEVSGDDPSSDLQQVKYLWHTLLAHGADANSAGDPSSRVSR